MKYQTFDWTNAIENLQEDARTLAIGILDDFVANIPQNN